MYLCTYGSNSLYAWVWGRAHGLTYHASPVSCGRQSDPVEMGHWDVRYSKKNKTTNPALTTRSACYLSHRGANSESPVSSQTRLLDQHAVPFFHNHFKKVDLLKSPFSFWVKMLFTHPKTYPWSQRRWLEGILSMMLFVQWYWGVEQPGGSRPLTRLPRKKNNNNKIILTSEESECRCSSR